MSVNKDSKQWAKLQKKVLAWVEESNSTIAVLYLPQSSKKNPCPHIRYAGSPNTCTFLKDPHILELFLGCAGIKLPVKSKRSIKDEMEIVSPDALLLNMDKKRVIISSIVRNYVMKTRCIQRDYWGIQKMTPPFWPEHIRFQSPNTCKGRLGPGLKADELSEILRSYIKWREGGKVGKSKEYVGREEHVERREEHVESREEHVERKEENVERRQEHVERREKHDERKEEEHDGWEEHTGRGDHDEKRKEEHARWNEQCDERKKEEHRRREKEHERREADHDERRKDENESKKKEHERRVEVQHESMEEDCDERRKKGHERWKEECDERKKDGHERWKEEWDERKKDGHERWKEEWDERRMEED